MIASFPRSELSGLTGQIRRAAVSIPSNVAEGYGRRTTRAYMNHVGISLGSSGELATCVTPSERLALLSQQDALRRAETGDEVGPMLSALFNSLDLKIRANEDR